MATSTPTLNSRGAEESAAKRHGDSGETQWLRRQALPPCLVSSVLSACANASPFPETVERQPAALLWLSYSASRRCFTRATMVQCDPSIRPTVAPCAVWAVAMYAVCVSSLLNSVLSMIGGTGGGSVRCRLARRAKAAPTCKQARTRCARGVAQKRRHYVL